MIGTILGESEMIKNYIENANFEDTGFAYTLSLISGKHKMVILYCLMEFETVRFNELKRYLKTISDKTLSTNLKELEADKLIVRTEYPQIPPKVEYTLSERGKSPAKGGIYAFGTRKIADDCAGSALCLGRGESTDRVITSDLYLGIPILSSFKWL